jgi:hypothetical protein
MQDPKMKTLWQVYFLKCNPVKAASDFNDIMLHLGEIDSIPYFLFEFSD